MITFKAKCRCGCSVSLSACRDELNTLTTYFKAWLERHQSCHGPKQKIVQLPKEKK